MMQVMEYCQGGSLHAAIRKARRPLDEDSVWRVLLHSAAALQHMHGR
jgi:serine/threonine protein kinase